MEPALVLYEEQPTKNDERTNTHDRCTARECVSHCKNERENWNKHVKLDLDLERPCDVVDDVLAAINDVVQIEEARNQMGKKNVCVLVIEQHQKDKKANHTDKIRGFKASQPSQEILFEANGFFLFQVMRRKRECEDETADNKEELHTMKALQGNSGKDIAFCREGIRLGRFYTKIYDKMEQHNSANGYEPKSIDLRYELP
jgi:hypothetical protein